MFLGIKNKNAAGNTAFYIVTDAKFSKEFYIS